MLPILNHPNVRIIVRITWFAMIGAVCVGSLLPAKSPVLKIAAHMNDKVEHGLAYFLLAGIPLFAGYRNTLLRVASGLVFLGLLLEVLQNYSPGRSCDFADFIADVVGVVCGITAGLLLDRHARAAEFSTGSGK
jgi:VanZ family protein